MGGAEGQRVSPRGFLLKKTDLWASTGSQEKVYFIHFPSSQGWAQMTPQPPSPDENPPVSSAL